MDDRIERIGLNEALFREVNERVKGITEGFGDRPDHADFVCECGDESCTERITMSLDSYERLRTDPTWFVVRPGHEIVDAERVIESRDDYVVVAKVEGDAARIALDTDPRS